MFATHCLSPSISLGLVWFNESFAFQIHTVWNQQIHFNPSPNTALALMMKDDDGTVLNVCIKCSARVHYFHYGLLGFSVAVKDVGCESVELEHLEKVFSFFYKHLYFIMSSFTF